MPRATTDSESLSPDDGLPGGLEIRRKKSRHSKCKRKRARSIRKGIDHYFERKNLKDALGDEYDEDDFEDFEEDEDWYH
ncbi:PA3496 family putative envelope integrity protein [Sansalvadorimonas verongulae]|uniref:PA3496 family putative envelope integrity protein n=1 Tax=Sansalvadorimonas verongulae TaxID=2172824 RepID=UPI0012BC18F0|nr:hypothetical protein [Sansalvadorimonas verongulae]MTI15071.1 hypothetical protein [Sansalvadorimonas verongulae]